ncbi:class I SAM-dependent methyltransferase [Methylobacterium aerolatum]|uniref:Methyltransferase n=1 Tax=Methylobacterium aerolatum TaxID=418708 RepID=A0ABU0HW59_9HYPH|nr:methyltransferase domain-containing protein [Methylobacterium aerolatum]MDQ0446572.1 putative methyltransferase [Methylobacterium aerolatum]GJD33267.1 2-phytyl-1,4-beta-naphthoquinone methyltransferase, chloroplastic [Methylobacterium aerolatum]
MIRLLLLLSAAFVLPAEAAGPLAPAGAPADAFPKPDRPVAEIIAPQWSPEADRDKTGEFETVVEAMRIRPGETVADIGAGSGYYVVRLSPKVGETGRILAEDVMPDYLAALERRVKPFGNVTVVQGEPHDPRLPPASVDAVVLVHMYHEITQPFGLLYNLAASMRPGGRVGILDADTIPSRHGTPPALLRCELKAVGYRETGFHPIPGGAYLAIFEAPAPENLPKPAAIRPCRDTATKR